MCVRANVNVVARVCLCCVYVEFLPAGSQNLWRGPIVNGFLQKSARENRGKGGSHKVGGLHEKEPFLDEEIMVIISFCKHTVFLNV